jgi:hypothetical protein
MNNIALTKAHLEPNIGYGWKKDADKSCRVRVEVNENPIDHS